MPKFFIYIIFSIGLVLSLSLPADANTPALTAQAAILMDMENKQILLAKNPDAPMYPASTTKIMTAMLAIQNGKLSDVVTVSDRADALAVDGSVIGLQKGEKITLQDLLYALLLPSANDAAIAIAEHIGGSVEDFAQQMNQKAQQIGANHTQFVNPHGLSHPDHYTTARALAQIAFWAMQNDTFKEIVATSHYHSGRTNSNTAGHQPAMIDFETTNRLLGIDPAYTLEGTTGIKTGYTSLAGRCLVFSVQQQGRQLLGVLLNSPGFEVYKDAHRLVHHGLHDFQRLELAQSGEHIATANIKGGLSKSVAAAAKNSCIYYVPVGQNIQPMQQISWQPHLAAPIKQGSLLGTAIWTLNNQTIGEVDLVAAEKVAAKPPIWLFILLLLVIIILRKNKIKQRRLASREPR